MKLQLQMPTLFNPNCNYPHLLNFMHFCTLEEFIDMLTNTEQYSKTFEVQSSVKQQISISEPS